MNAQYSRGFIISILQLLPSVKYLIIKVDRMVTPNSSIQNKGAMEEYPRVYKYTGIPVKKKTTAATTENDFIELIFICHCKLINHSMSY
jgi:hypothetical protein